MEKRELLRNYENYIQNTYHFIHEIKKENLEIEKNITLLYQRLKENHDLSAFYHRFSLLQNEKFWNLIALKEEEVNLLIMRTRVWYELGLISQEERIECFSKATESYDWAKEIHNTEYQARLLELASHHDMESKEYEQLVRHIYSKKKKGATIKHYTKSKLGE